jgi:hypothetical protein
MYVALTRRPKTPQRHAVSCSNVAHNFKHHHQHSNIMKLTLIATTFAALLLSTGYAAETNDRNLDAVPTAGVESPAMETQGMEPGPFSTKGSVLSVLRMPPPPRLLPR